MKHKEFEVRPTNKRGTEQLLEKLEEALLFVMRGISSQPENKL